jgi:UDP-N-acetylmuramoyl-tripeptide--D-alanyl-D-alanine ligase
VIPLDLADLADVVGGDLLDEGDGTRLVTHVTIDSRQAVAGSLFVPLPGERTDGHDHIAPAVAQGAAGHLHAEDRPPTGQPGAVVVDDPADALMGLGAWIRESVDPTVVAVTGSQGKTTTKDLIAAAAGAADPGSAGLSVVAAPGSYNNELGLPLTLCMLEADSDVVVTEMGTRGIGHIARLVPVARPDIAVVTAVGASHLELLGSVDQVAVAKTELVEGLDADGLAVLNADDRRVASMAARAPGRVVTYGVDADADWRARDVRFDELARPMFTAEGPAGERVDVRLAVLGAHNVSNALAALAVAVELGVPPGAAASALAGARVSRWRMELTPTADGLVVLNDAYNANPASMEAGLAL